MRYRYGTLKGRYHRTIPFIETFGRYLWMPSSVHICVPGNSTVAVAQATAKRRSVSASLTSFASIYANPATIASPAPWRPLTSTGGTSAFHAPLGPTSIEPSSPREITAYLIPCTSNCVLQEQQNISVAVGTTPKHSSYSCALGFIRRGEGSMP